MQPELLSNFCCTLVICECKLVNSATQTGLFIVCLLASFYWKDAAPCPNSCLSLKFSHGRNTGAKLLSFSFWL